MVGGARRASESWVLPGSLCANNQKLVCRKTDARGITTTYTYDALDRLSGKSYSNGDTSVTYYYDQTSYNGLTISNGKGQRTRMTDGSGQTAWSYDKMGRVAAEERTIGSVTKTLGYTYNLDGSLASLTYPSGRTVNYAPSAVGRPLTAIDTADNITYVGSANSTYAPQGALATAAYGPNLAFSATYNNRLLPSNLQGYTSSATLFELEPAYNPNGSVSSVTNGVNSGRTQTFTYDYLNRITSASSAATSGTYCWGQSVPTNGTGYDRYGNLLIINVSQCTAPTLNVSVNAYNQITNSGFSYDAAGNMTGDGSYSYAWNGEGLLKSAGTTTYTYDGDDKRVEKSSGTYYWLSPSGSVLAETDTSGNTQNEYIYFSGRRTARRDSSGNVYYYFQDQIGTSRLIANSSGTVCYDADYTPFGYEMAYTTTCSQNYKFTGMERDVETGNDHAWFRNYEQNLGRWMSPDPLPGGVANPQTLNRYAYVINNPTSLTDPLGLCEPVNGIPCHPVYDPSTCDNIACPGPGGGGGGNLIWGNDIFDAISGAPGTYLTLDMYGNLGFGFSPELWAQTWNYIDTTRQDNPLLAFLVPTSGYVVVERNLGTGVETSGLIPEIEALAQERLQLAVAMNAGGYYLEQLAKNGFGPDNPVGENYEFWQTMLFVENSWSGLGYSQDPTLGYAGYLNAYGAEYQTFSVYQCSFVGFCPKGW